MKVNSNDLRCDMVLFSGQSFRWKRLPSGNFAGPIGTTVYVLKQTTDDILFHTQPAVPQEKGAEILKDYFQLNHDMRILFKSWSDADTTFAKIAPRFSGLRILRQDPLENLISFICSSNNNITRISLMIERLCAQYGTHIADVEGITFHAFPTLAQLSMATEEQLRALGFGYRARFVVAAATTVRERGIEWLHRLRTATREEAHSELMGLLGVGAKVADCVCLMSQDKADAIPVDTHVFQIAVRHYLPHLKGKTVTPKVYTEIADFFRSRFGPFAGWAHSVLFTADLAAFRDDSDASIDKKSSSKRKQQKAEKIQVGLDNTACEPAAAPITSNAKRTKRRL